MRTYHGTGDANGILLKGFDPDHGASWGAEEGHLRSLGGLYCTVSPGAATKYALRGTIEFGGTPSILVLEVDESKSLADEDQLNRCLLNNIGHAEKATFDQARDIARQMNASKEPTDEQVSAVFQWANESLAVRMDEGVDCELFERYREYTDKICNMFPWTSSAEFSIYWGYGCHTFRLSDFSPTDFTSDGKILKGSTVSNVIDIETSVDGLDLLGITGRFEEIDDDDRTEIAEAWADDVEEKTGIRPESHLDSVPSQFV